MRGTRHTHMADIDDAIHTLLADDAARQTALAELHDEFGQTQVNQTLADALRQHVMALYDERETLQAAVEQPDSEDITAALTDE